MYKLMKNLIIIIILCLSGNTFAQDIKLKLDVDYTTIKDEYSQAITKYTEEGVKYLILEKEEVIVWMYFNEKDICDMQVYAYEISILGNMLKAFNNDKDFIKVSATEYILVTENKILSYEILIEERIILLFIKKI